MSNDHKKLIDDAAKALFGKTHTEAVADGKCIDCGTTDLVFRDEQSEDEFALTRLCQECQNEIFGEYSDG